MTKITLLSLTVAALLFTACGEDSKKAATEASAKTTEVAKGTVSDLEKAATQAADATKKAAEELAEAAKAKADKAGAAAKKELSKAVVSESEGADGTQVYAKCSGCHGKDGKTKALGKSEVIAGQSAGDLVTKLKEYKAGKRNVAGMGTLMKGQVASLSEADILSVSEYISGL